ncbi:hypothetical protein F4820DRAFT_463678 [Hypoxylon rubiginosum]|uniref:Uncharacterized protein n=1 Tax=Hypoxylon rubiginosum TaxID=110542 RepID=A0ACB9YT39_9PEZI|nr:hypothetical protein F4820DRAFT_463678 [Hypoxylon rubiginosum]
MDRNVNGHGVTNADWALEDLVKHPEKLEHDRARFDRSPSQNMEYPSGTTTKYGSPEPRSEELEKRYQEIVRERDASRPREQLNNQSRKEQEVVLEAIINRTLDIPPGTKISTVARANVKARWVEQGIWNDKWNTMADGCWKHEIDDLPEPETEGSTAGGKKISKRKKKKSVAQATRPPTKEERERQASRPFHQFIYQVSLAREEILRDLKIKEDSIYVPEDINTRAYDTVKDTWTEWGIWDTKWSTLPGMSFKHERPLSEFLDDDLIAYEKEMILGSHPSLLNLPPVIKQVRFEQPGQDKEKTASGEISSSSLVDDAPGPSNSTGAAENKKGKRFQLYGEVRLFGEYDSRNPSLTNKEERSEPDSEPDSEVTENERCSHSDDSMEDKDMLDWKPPKNTKYKKAKGIKHSSKPKGITKTKEVRKNKKKKELMKKMEEYHGPILDKATQEDESLT